MLSINNIVLILSKIGDRNNINQMPSLHSQRVIAARSIRYARSRRTSHLTLKLSDTSALLFRAPKNKSISISVGSRLNVT